jgi:hypothetical protein
MLARKRGVKQGLFGESKNIVRHPLTDCKWCEPPNIATQLC